MVRQLCSLFAAAFSVMVAFSAHAYDRFNLYGGLHFSSTLGETEVTPSLGAGEKFDLRPTGPSFGGLLGLHLRFGWFGLGGEGEISKLRWNGTTVTRVGGSVTETELEMDQGTRMRARLGVHTGNFFIFVAGGGSEADSQMNLQSLNSPGQTSRASETLKGSNVGLGFDYAAGEGSLEKRFRLRVEYIMDTYDGTIYRTSRPNPFFVDRRIEDITAHTFRTVVMFTFF